MITELLQEEKAFTKSDGFKKAKILSKEIVAVTGLDIFRNTRKSDYIEARAIFNFILYNSIGLSLHKIATFYRIHNKNMDHATVLHSLKNFDVYRRFSKNVNEWLEKLEATELGDSSKRALMSQFVTFLEEDRLDSAYNFLKDLYYQQEEEFKHSQQKVKN